MRAVRLVRPLEWALLAFFVFVFFRAGPTAFAPWRDLLTGRASTVLFTLGLVWVAQLSFRFRKLAWAPGSDERLQRLLWTALPFSLLPWLFAVSVVIRSPLIQEDLPKADAPTAVAALAGMFLTTVGFGLPTILGWLCFANLLREHGTVKRKHVTQGLGLGASIFRDWFPLLVVLSGYEWMRAVVDAGFKGPKDYVMRAIDQVFFFDHDPLDWLQMIIWKPLTEVLAFGYSFYAVLFPLVLGTIAVTGGRQALRLAAFRVGTALLFAYVMYCLVPVKGPLFTRSFDVPLDMYLIGPIKEAMMDANRISYDCFPSMHTCCSLLLGVCAWQWARKLFWVISPIVVLMPLACCYLRYHYVVDVLAGLVLVPAIVWVSNQFEHE
ncbi:MAG: phosphatase PAP2 family protein [Myxococcaceae bacterium]